MLLDKTAILSSLKLKTEDMPLGGGTIRVSELGGSDYLKIWTDPAYQDGNGNVDMSKFTPALLAYTIIDENGNRLFSDDEVPELAKAAAGPFLDIAKVAKRLNGLTGEEVKNSEAGQIDCSCSDSACNSDAVTPTN